MDFSTKILPGRERFPRIFHEAITSELSFVSDVSINETFLKENMLFHYLPWNFNLIIFKKRNGFKSARGSKRLNADSYYAKQFQKVFRTNEIKTTHLLKALTQFTVSLVSADSKYDQIIRKGAGVLFTDQERNGYALFKTNCASCHTEPLFTSTRFASNGLPIDSDYTSPQEAELARRGASSRADRKSTASSVRHRCV